MAGTLNFSQTKEIFFKSFAPVTIGSIKTMCFPGSPETVFEDVSLELVNLLISS